MNTLIPLQQTEFLGEMKQTVNARVLHEFLEVETRFNDWIKTRINDFNFIENVDYILFTEKSVKGRPSIEYFLTLEMAKELSMVERNDKGKQARQYFIACEKKLKQIAPAFPAPQTMLEALELAVSQQKQIISLEKDNGYLEEQKRLMAPQVDAFKRLGDSTGAVCLTDAAKLLKVKPKELTALMNGKGWVYKRHGTSWIAYQDKLDAGFLNHKAITYTRTDGTAITTQQAVVTPKGLAALAKLINTITA